LATAAADSIRQPGLRHTASKNVSSNKQQLFLEHHVIVEHV